MNSRIVSLLLIICVGVTGAQGDGTWEWPGESLGFGGDYVREMIVWDDGTGPALYVGGLFFYAGAEPGVNCIAKWDGKEWSKLGTGLSYSGDAMAVFDDGSGPALFVGGDFNSAGGVPVKNIAKWNGLTWSAVGDSLTFSPRSLAVFDDGSGQRLYAGGEGLWKWDGKVWTYLGPSIPAIVYSLAVFDGGSGARLHLGGKRYSGAPYFATWDGQGLLDVELPAGTSTFAGDIRALTSFENGTKQQLFVSGFLLVEQSPVQMYVWDGSGWTKADAGLVKGAYYNDFVVAGAGKGAELYAIGPPSAVRWEGSHWVQLDYLGGNSGPILAGAMFDDGSGPRLHVGGSIQLDGKWTNTARQTSPSGGTPSCGDLNGDGFVNQQDLGILLADYGCTKGKGLCPGDVDGDGDTDQSDLGILLSNYEKACP